ncbi:MAG: hypothetical protein WAQ29_07070, partial [Nitrososphaeraceae archaeon]
MKLILRNTERKPVADISIEELSNLASMPMEQAKRMAQRDYGETLLQIQSEDISRFTRYAQEAGMKVIHGDVFLMLQL